MTKTASLEETLPPFQPPWWLRSGHIQTLLGAYWSAITPTHKAIARQITLDDGDIVVVHDDCPTGWTHDGQVALLAHGMGGCHRSPLLTRLVDKLNARGVRVFRWDMRACGAGLGLAAQTYHAGRSDDLSVVINSVLGWCEEPNNLEIVACDHQPATSLKLPHSSGEFEKNTEKGTYGSSLNAPHFLSRSSRSTKARCKLSLFGVSLSGNILLKYLGEFSESIPSQVVQAIAVNPPIDLAASVKTLDGRLNRFYDRHFAGSLTNHVDKHRRLRPDAPMPAVWKRPRSMFEFDSWYTAPMSGYSDAAAYYASCSAAPLIPAIKTPTTIITADNDPMVPVELFSNSSLRLPESVQLSILRGGGHVGYINRRGVDPDVHWLDWRVVDLITA